MQIRSDLIYLLKLSRPRFWFYLAGPALLGIIYGSTELLDNLFLKTALFLYFLIPANIFLYGVNDYFDRRIDTKNPKKQGKEVKYTKNIFVNTLVVSSGLLGLLIVYLIGDIFASVIMVLFLFLSVFYSAPPLRFKTKVFLDSLSNILYILPGLIVFIALSDFESLPLTVVFSGFTWSMAMHTFSAVPDIKPDVKAGITTTATYLGIKNTLIYCFVLWILSAGLLSLYSYYAGLLMSIYPGLLLFYVVRNISIRKAYWWYPYINSFTGFLFVIFELWRHTANGF